jgi:hypothetical protein
MNFVTAVRPLKIPNRTFFSKEAQKSYEMLPDIFSKDTMTEDMRVSPKTRRYKLTWQMVYLTKWQGKKAHAKARGNRTGGRRVWGIPPRKES